MKADTIKFCGFLLYSRGVALGFDVRPRWGRAEFPKGEQHKSPARIAGTAAFTLLEILIAVVILSIVAVVLLPAHIRALQAEDRARSLEELRRVAQETVVETYLGELPSVLTNQARWTTDMEPTTIQDQTNSLAASRFQIGDPSLPGVRADFYVLERAGSAASTNANR